MKQHENEAPAVVYFDATVRRKEKMRLASAQGSMPNSPAAVEAASAPIVSAANIPAPVVPAPTRVPDPPTVAPVASLATATTASSDPPVIPEPKSASNGAGSVSSTATSPASSNGLTSETLSSFLVNFVVEHTGYPPEIVEMDADLEADLGIDSIKVAQMFGELREQFGVRASDDVGLDDFPTLQHIMDYLVPS